MIYNKNILILGLNKNNFEVIKLILNDNKVTVLDVNNTSKEILMELEKMNVSYIKTDNLSFLIDKDYDMVIKDTNINDNNEMIVMMKKRGIPILNELEVSYHYLPNAVNIISVTGSSGKTTTSTLIYEMLKKDNLKVFLGNSNKPLASFVLDCKPGDFVILEVNDKELCNTIEFTSHIAILTNLYSLNTDFYNNYNDYKEIEKKIFINQNKYDIAIFNKDNEDSILLSNIINSDKKYFSLKENANCFIQNESIYYDNRMVIDVKDIKLIGRHNLENILGAICAVHEIGVSDGSIISVLKNFNGVEHAMEYVTSLYNVAFYNDSKSVNSYMTIKALMAIKTPVLLILGGSLTNNSYDELKPYLKNVKYIAAIGETRELIKDMCYKENILCETFATLYDAVLCCYANAVAYDTILFSPASEPYDMYNSVEERGNDFKRIVKELEIEE